MKKKCEKLKKSSRRATRIRDRVCAWWFLPYIINGGLKMMNLFYFLVWKTKFYSNAALVLVSEILLLPIEIKFLSSRHCVILSSIYFLPQNPCNSAPCHNSGKCFVGYTEKKYACECLPGFTGEHCEHCEKGRRKNIFCFYLLSVCLLFFFFFFRRVG